MAINDFCVMEPDDFWPAVYAWVILPLLVALWVQASHAYPFVQLFLKDVCICFLTFYSFDTISLTIV
jgi:hypothetical protein